MNVGTVVRTGIRAAELMGEVGLETAKAAGKLATKAHNIYKHVSPIQVSPTTATVNYPWQLGIAPKVEIKDSATGPNKFLSGAGWGAVVRGGDKTTARSLIYSETGKDGVARSMGTAVGGEDSFVRAGYGVSIAPESADKAGGYHKVTPKPKVSAKKTPPAAKTNKEKSNPKVTKAKGSRGAKIKIPTAKTGDTFKIAA